MGFNSTATTITINAYLTPFGRKQLVSTNNSLITSFALGDSDAFYDVVDVLETGQVPTLAGTIGPSSTISNSTTQNVGLKSVLIVSGNGTYKKPVEPQSVTVVSEVLANGQVTISGSNISYNQINRNDYATDSLVNLFYSFSLPLNTSQDIRFTGSTYANGGYSNTGLSGLAQTNILVLGIDNSTYGESLDGKEIKLELPTSAGTYTLYSTFQNKGASLSSEDNNYRDTSTLANSFGNNVAFLFSDDIMTPNGGSLTLSWATGFGAAKPFSVGNKRLFNLQTDSNVGATADTCVGIAFLDKGFLVITNPQIVSDYTASASTGTTITLNSVSTSVYQNITCVANRGEFGTSTNSTFGGGDIPRVTEIGLYDVSGNLIAYGKTDRQVEKNINSPLYLGVNIKI